MKKYNVAFLYTRRLFEVTGVWEYTLFLSSLIVNCRNIPILSCLFIGYLYHVVSLNYRLLKSDV